MHTRYASYCLKKRVAFLIYTESPTNSYFNRTQTEDLFTPYSKAANRKTKKNETSLMNTFQAIETVLYDHHKTTREPLNVQHLLSRTHKNGTPVTIKDLEHVLQVWPSAYELSHNNSETLIKAADLPLELENRLALFTAVFNDKENRSSKIQTDTVKKFTPPDGKVNKRPILVGRAANTSAQSEPKRGSLLDRIRAKEAQYKQKDLHTEKKSAQDAYLMSQIPKLERVLRDLCSKRNTSIELSKMMEIMRLNLFKLSDEEIYRSLKLLASTSSICKVVTVDDTTHVKLVST